MGRKGGRTWPRGGRNLGLQRHGGSPRYGSLLIKQVTLDQLLEEFIPVQLTNHGAGIVVIGDISGVFSQEIPDNLIDGIVALFLRASKTEWRIRCMFSRSSPGTVNLMVLSFNMDSSFYV